MLAGPFKSVIRGDQGNVICSHIHSDYAAKQLDEKVYSVETIKTSKKHR